MEKKKIKEKGVHHFLGLTDLGHTEGTPSPLPLWPSSVGGFTRLFPFTASQWQELQRQSLIYKHIVASVPIPCHLLLPSAASSFPQHPTIDLRRFKNGMMDVEPGRCRRTDGKKWRCAWDVEPEQKYCQKHLNRKRPRSRKPVEQQCLQSREGNDGRNGKASIATVAAGFVPRIGLNLPFQAVESKEEQERCQDWTKGYSENPSSNRRWELMLSNTGLKYDTNSNVEQYEGLKYDTDTSDTWWNFLNPNPSLLDETRIHNNEEPPPRRFIDAWSTAITTTTTKSSNESSVVTKDKFSPSALTLSISNAIEEGSDMQIRMGFGGPLGEVLQSSNKMTSPRNSGNELINLMCMSNESSWQNSPLVSPASRISQKGIISLSDNSSSSSPSFVAASRSDFAFKWMNLNR